MIRTRTTDTTTWRAKSRGFAAASSLASGPLRTAASRRGIAEARLLTQWPEIVGPRLARLSRPIRIKHDRGGHGLGGVLILAVNGPRASEIELETPQIVDRVNAFYGYRAVVDVKLTQSASAATEIVEERRAAAADPASLPVAKRRALAELTEPVGDEALRDALTRLGANVMTRPRTAPARGSSKR